MRAHEPIRSWSRPIRKRRVATAVRAAGTDTPATPAPTTAAGSAQPVGSAQPPGDLPVISPTQASAAGTAQRRERSEAGGDVTVLTALLRDPAPPPAPDGAAPAVATVHDAGRLILPRVGEALGWQPAPTTLAWRRGPRRGLIALTQGQTTDPSSLRLDARRRLQLPSALRAALACEAGQALVVLPEPTDGVLWLMHPGLAYHHLSAAVGELDAADRG